MAKNHIRSYNIFNNLQLANIPALDLRINKNNQSSIPLRV
jgi:hypothetical protein